MEDDNRQSSESIQLLIQKQLEVVHRALGIEPVEKQGEELSLDEFTEKTSLERISVNHYTKKSTPEELAEKKHYLFECRTEAKITFATNQAMFVAAKARFIDLMNQRRSTKERMSKTANRIKSE